MFTFFYLSVVFICTAALAQQDTKCFDDVALPPEYGRTPRLRHGEFLFPDLTFNCGGTIKNITMGVQFIENYTYSSVLTVKVSLWRKNGSHFHRVIEKDHVIPLDLSDGDYPLRRNPNGNFSMGDGTTVSILFSDVDIRVEEGEILGLSVPSATENMVTGITVAVNANYSDSPIVTLHPVWYPECWSIDGFVTPCQIHAIAAYGKPFIMFDFIRDSVHVPEPDTSSDSETGLQINGLIATVFAAVLGTLACASLVLLAAFLSVSLCCKQNREKGVVDFRERYVTMKSIELAGDSDEKPTNCAGVVDFREPYVTMKSIELAGDSDVKATKCAGVVNFREPYVTMKSIELAGDSDVKPTAHDPQYDYARVTVVRGPTKPARVGLSPETHSYSHLKHENSTAFGKDSKHVTTPGGGGCYDSIDQSGQYLNTSVNVTNPGPDKQPQKI